MPEIGPDEMALKTLASGCCCGETMAWYKSVPKVLGHEPVGEVVEIGGGVTDFPLGDRPFVNHHDGQANSHLLRRGHFTRDAFYQPTKPDPGGVCEYDRVSAQHLAMDAHKLPETISTEAAVTIEPWSSGLSGLKVCHSQPGDTVAVVGVGCVGQGFLLLVPRFGAGKVVAPVFSDWRLAKACEYGATHPINPKSEDAEEAMHTLNNGRLADTSVAAALFPLAWDRALKLVEVGGLHLGAPLRPRQIGCETATPPVPTRSP